MLIGISVNQLKSLPDGTSALGLVATGAYLYTLIFVRIQKFCHSLMWLACVFVYGKSDFLLCNNIIHEWVNNYFDWWNC